MTNNITMAVENRMKYIIFPLALLLVGCQGAGIDVAALAIAVADSIRPALAQIKGLDPEQVTAIVAAIKDGIAGNLKLPDGGFDWGPLVTQVVLVIGGMFGVNIARNRARRKRGESV